jgi:Meiotically Up-regulated Gene 113 (MUG113) protein
MLTKQEVLSEIRRYSKKIGGKTPSEKKLYENTEVGVYDRMRYWPNYGSLVKDIGLKPNKFDKTKYSRKHLCDTFIEVIRENGKWPTRGILDVKHHNDPNFPDSSTFYKKLGLIRELVNTIIDFIEDKKGYDDVTKICNSVLEKYSGRDKKVEDENLASGYVYLGKQHGVYKIGKTKNTKRRRDDITLLGSEPFRLIHEIKTDDMNGVEKYWHNRFKTKHKRGEWFNLSRADVSALKRWKKIS